MTTAGEAAPTATLRTTAHCIQLHRSCIEAYKRWLTLYVSIAIYVPAETVARKATPDRAHSVGYVKSTAEYPMARLNLCASLWSWWMGSTGVFQQQHDVAGRGVNPQLCCAGGGGEARKAARSAAAAGRHPSQRRHHRYAGPRARLRTQWAPQDRLPAADVSERMRSGTLLYFAIY